jgi:predicted signal transduction protein with EAL and GGDEF domain
LFEDAAPFSGLPGVPSVLQRFGRCAQVLLLCWSGQLDSAAEELLAVQDRLGPGNYAQVANFFGHWVAAELHLARHDLGAAELEATILIDKAGASTTRIPTRPGDEVLKTVAQAIRGSVRESDLPARFGGDEFVVLFQRTDIGVARRVCARLQETLAGLRWEHLSPQLRVSVSIGVCEAQPGDTPASLLRRSDAAMFEEKAWSPARSDAVEDSAGPAPR